MRTFTKYATAVDTKQILRVLCDFRTNVDEYRNAFEHLGKVLGQAMVLNDRLVERMMLACAAEDADWLASGVLQGMQQEKMPLAVFWNDRVSVATLPDGRKIEISPIIKSYVDDVNECDTLIIVKSIISTSCVIKTQLMRLLDMVHPQKIIVLAPVMFKGADEKLKCEFPKAVSSIMEFITLAIDDERDGNIVIPGVGGMVYPKLGLGDGRQKNSYMPNIIWSRIEK